MEFDERRWLANLEERLRSRWTGEDGRSYELDFLQDEEAQSIFVEEFCDRQFQLAYDWGDDIDWEPPSPDAPDEPSDGRMKRVVKWALPRLALGLLKELLMRILFPRIRVSRFSYRWLGRAPT